MKKSKKNLAIVAVLLITLLAFIGGQAYAKYFIQIQGQGVAQVATWDFKVNGSSNEVQQIRLCDTSDSDTLIGGKIAPGTSGSFNIVVDASESEVAVNYKVMFQNEKNKPKNLKFNYNGMECYTIESLNHEISETINAGREGETGIRNITINWMWEYETGTVPKQIEANDAIDTADAKAMQDYTFDVLVTGTQVNPN